MQPMGLVGSSQTGEGGAGWGKLVNVLRGAHDLLGVREHPLAETVGEEVFSSGQNEEEIPWEPRPDPCHLLDVLRVHGNRVH